MLRWYVEHGAVIKTVHRTIDYQMPKIFIWFVEQVTETRPTGDVDGKLIAVLERQTSVSYTLVEKVVDRSPRSAYFHELSELGRAN